jgi:Protein of unknown function (DUF3631)
MTDDDYAEDMRAWYAEDNPDGAELLDELRATIKRFCVLPGEHELTAVVLWVVLTHLLEKFDYAPRLHIRSVEKRSGKSRLLTIINGLVYSPLPTANCTTAYIYRSLGGDRPPTLLFDEVDAIFGSKKVAENNEDLRALINAGVERDAPVGRTVGPNHIPAEFETFAMAALAGIGRLPDTIEDRAVVVVMKRRTGGERVEPFRRRRDRGPLHELRDRVAAWADVVREKAGTEYPDLPIDDRAADVWEPLVSVADLAGGDWPESARAAAVALSEASAEDDSRSLNVKLLNDIETLFAEEVVDSFVKSTDLCQQLRKLDESPWNDHELTPSKLGRRLSDNFRIRTRHSSDKKARGYHRVDFTDAFIRYPRCPTASDPVPQASDQPEQSEHLGVPKVSRSRPDTFGAAGGGHLWDAYGTPSGEKDSPSSDGINTAWDAVGHLSGGKRVCGECKRAAASTGTDLCGFCAAKAEASVKR